MKSCRPFWQCIMQQILHDALNKADQLVQDGGYGHTASLYIDTVHERERLDQFAARMKACRIVVNTPSSHGGIGDLVQL